MDNVILVENEDSDNSIIVLEVPKKPTPPLILIEDEEMVLNVTQMKQESILAEDFINENHINPVMNKNKINIKSSYFSISPKHWTTDMIKFYNDDWGDEEQFIVEKLQEKMDKSPFLWEISKKDAHFLKNKNRRSYVTCWKCGEQGHFNTECKSKPRVPKCYMCGLAGHLIYSCPNSKCLNCGNASKEYVNFCFKCRKQSMETCSRCKTLGHNFLSCSDHWRMFHITTEDTSVRIPEENIYKSNDEMWCCNCGKQGHYQTWCIQKRDCGAFRDSLPFVVSYQKAFNDSFYEKHTNRISSTKHKNKWKFGDTVEKNIRINPMNKAISKNRLQLPSKTKKRKKKKRKRKNNTRGNQEVLNCISI